MRPGALAAAFLFTGALAVLLMMREADWSPLIIHGGLMIFAWIILAPLCVLIARFLKVMPGQDFPQIKDNPFWWRWHWIGQSVAVAISTAGFAAIVIAKGGAMPATTHGALGLCIVIAGWLQIIGGLLRGSKGGPTDARADPARPETWRGDHYDMTLRRRIFEGAHKAAGYGAVLLAPVAAWQGLELAGIERLVSVSTQCFTATIAIAFIAGEWAGWRVPTWRAIWGDEPPGRV